MDPATWDPATWDPSTWPAWISAIANLIVAATAVVTAILAYKQYLRAPEQEPEPSAERDEAAAPAEALTVFRTSKQRTYLTVSARGLECHLEDTRPDRGGHQWTIAPRDAAAILEREALSVNPAHTARTGLFSVGPRRNWLYSKALFPDPDFLRGALRDLLRQTAASAA